MQSESEDSDGQQSPTAASSSGEKSRFSTLLIVLANAPPDNRTVKDEFAMSPPSPMQQAVATQQPAGRHLSSGKRSHILQHFLDLALANALLDDRVFPYSPTVYNARGDYSPSGAPSTVIFPQRSGIQNATTPLGNT
jgi:hypothetical protein